MAKKSSGEKKSQPKVQAIVGLGLDNQDGHKRVTELESITLVGGSHETHERMQDTAIRFSEALDKRGKKLQEVPLPDVISMMREAQERTR